MRSSPPSSAGRQYPPGWVIKKSRAKRSWRWSKAGLMNVLRLHGLKDLRLPREPLPTPGAGEVLLRMTSVGVCGSDLHWFSELGIGDAGLTHPLVLGHEFAGVVESPGSALHGARVAAEPD